MLFNCLDLAEEAANDIRKAAANDLKWAGNVRRCQADPKPSAPRPVFPDPLPDPFEGAARCIAPRAISAFSPAPPTPTRC